MKRRLGVGLAGIVGMLNKDSNTLGIWNIFFEKWVVINLGLGENEGEWSDPFSPSLTSDVVCGQLDR